ncbi:MAG: hypothetical protein RRA94_08790, partial [Bacteroidota bacterium]|nr:hypothetical protein [Bacteroidota bacterium]
MRPPQSIPALLRASLLRASLLRRAAAMSAALALALLFPGCGGSAWLERAVQAGSADWTQEGG